MSTQARESLRHLTAALEAHLEAVEARRAAEDASVDDAFDAVAEAFERYEDALDSTYGEALPLMLDEELADELDADDEGDFDDDSDEDDLDDDDDDDDDEVVEDLDPHAVEDEDVLDDDIEAFDLR